MLTTTIAPTGGHRPPGRLRRRERAARRAARSAASSSRIRSSTGRSAAGATSTSTPASGRRPADARSSAIAEISRRRSASTELLERPVGSYSGGAAPPARDRPRARLAARRCSSSTSRPSGSIRASAHELLDLIAGLRARSEMTILLTTHYLDEAEQLCDRDRDHPRRPRSSPSTPRTRSWPASAGNSSSCAVDGDAASRTGGAALARHRRRRRVHRRRQPHRAAARARPQPTRSPRSTSSALATAPSAPGSRRSTTSTCS